MAYFLYTTNQGKLSEFQKELQPQGMSVYGISALEPFLGKNHWQVEEDSDSFLCNGFAKLLACCLFLEDTWTPLSIEQYLVDDSGLCVPELNDLPGVHSASYGGLPKSDEKNRNRLKNAILKCPDAFPYGEEEKRLGAFFCCFLLSITRTENFSFFLEFLKKHFFQNSTIKASTIYTDEIVKKEKELFQKRDPLQVTGQFHISLDAKLFLPTFPRSYPFSLSFAYCCGFVSSKEQNHIAGAGHGYDSLFYSMEKPEISFASMTIAAKNKLSHRGAAIKNFLSLLES